MYQAPCRLLGTEMRDHPCLQGVWGGQRGRGGEACQELSLESSEVAGAMKDTGHRGDPVAGRGEEACGGWGGREGRKVSKRRGHLSQARGTRSLPALDDLSLQGHAVSQPVSSFALCSLPSSPAPPAHSPVSEQVIWDLDTKGEVTRVSERMEGPNSL